MNIKSIAILISAIWLNVTNLHSANVLHAINFCATNAENISVGVRADHDNFINEVSILGDLIGYDVKFYDYPGENCSKENLQKVLNQLQSNPEDIIIFYYSGHGGRNKNDQSKFPQMCLKYNAYQQANFMPVHYVQDMLRAKSGRLKLIMTDCCNVASNIITPKGIIAGVKGATEVSNNEAQNYRKLFFSKNGMLTFSGSEIGKPSYGPDDGGCFSNSFWEVLYKVGKGAVAPKWEDVVDLTTRLTNYVTSNADYPQTPIHQNELVDAVATTTNTTTPVNTTVAPTPNPVNATNSNTSNSLQKLTSATNVDSRINLIPQAMQNFTNNAVVQVVGRNLSTIVQTTNIQDYLDGVAISKHIKGLNVIEEKTNPNGKTTYIKLHEIRKQ